MIVTTLKEYVEQKLGFTPARAARCPGCGMPTEAFALTKCASGKWRCGHCRVDAEREAAPPWQLSWGDVRGHRAVLLAETDWTQLADVPEETRILWQPYRQALRDITLQQCEPDQVVWPQKPGE